jgi:putative transposase
MKRMNKIKIGSDSIYGETSARAREDQRLLALIRASYTASHGVYGAPRIFLDLREANETCSKHRVARIMRANQIRARYGYRTPRCLRGRTSLRVPNTLQRRFTVEQPNEAWSTDITYVRTWQGWLYLAVVMDLYSRRIVGWSTKPTLGRELVLDAVLKAVWQRNPQTTLIHSDQGSREREELNVTTTVSITQRPLMIWCGLGLITLAGLFQIIFVYALGSHG